jgi:hypothetical protein
VHIWNGRYLHFHIEYIYIEYLQGRVLTNAIGNLPEYMQRYTCEFEVEAVNYT